VRPGVTKISENGAAEEAGGVSPANAKEQPRPAAAPPTAAITGLGRFQTARIAALKPSSSTSSFVADWLLRPARKSAPDENALPAPVSTITRLYSSLALSMTASLRAKMVSRSRALCRSGRLIVIQRTLPCLSLKTTPLIRYFLQRSSKDGCEV